jgi:D-erythronate 2-dehydrogenase
MTGVLVTGADGYIGRAVAARLTARLQAGEIDSLTLLDQRFGIQNDAFADGRVRCISGDLGDPCVLAQATEPAPEVVFHLAGITSRQAEEDFALGLRVNVVGTIGLFERLRVLGRRPIVVCASSIGVYGTPLPEVIDDLTPVNPTLSYGAEKRMIEILLADYSRRGWIDGRAPRLPSVVARPAAADGALSAFASDLIREPAQGRRYACPIGPEGSLWLLSLPACVHNLLHAADVAADRLPAGRAWNLPALRATARQIVQSLCKRFGPSLADRVEYRPVPSLQAQFASWPALSTGLADSLGFRHDGDLATLIAQALRH